MADSSTTVWFVRSLLNAIENTDTDSSSWRILPAAEDLLFQAKAVFTTFLVEHVDGITTMVAPELWRFHIERLQTAVAAAGCLFESGMRGVLPATLKNGQYRVRWLVQPGSTDLFMSYSPFEKGPNLQYIVPVLGTWPPYRQKWWQRALYQRQRPLKFSTEIWHRLLVDDRSGQLMETDTANLLLQHQGQWYTPSANNLGILQGTQVQYLLQAGFIKEKLLFVRDLQRADRLRVCNALGQVEVQLQQSFPPAIQP